MGDSDFTLAVLERQTCVKTVVEEHAAMVTRTTALDAKDKEMVNGVGVAGAATLAVGVIGGLVTSGVVLYDPSLKDGAGNFVPVADQAGFALWPIGVTAIALGVTVGGAGAAAPFIVGAQEATQTAEEVTSQERTDVDETCSRDDPLADERATLVVDGVSTELGQTSRRGAMSINVDTVFNAMLTGERPKSRGRIELSPSKLVILVDIALADGLVDRIQFSASSTESLVFPSMTSTAATRWNAPRVAAKAAARARDEELQAEAEAARARDAARLAADEAAKPQEADELLTAIMAGDVYTVFKLKRPSTPVKQKLFEESDAEYQAKVRDLAQRRQDLRGRTFYVEVEGGLSDYDIDTRSVSIVLGGNYQGGRKGWGPKMIDGVVLPQLPTRRAQMEYQKAGIYEEVFDFPVAEAVGAKIEGKRMKFRVFFKPINVQTMTWGIFEYPAVVGSVVEAVLFDAASGDVHYRWRPK